jgi:SAM-dependent methyltransferase
VQRDQEKEEARLIRWCLSTVAGNALEVGCGNGLLTADLAQIADNLVAVDPSVEELRSARRRVEIPVKFVVAFAESLPIAANSIDTVAFTRSLHHQEPHKALSEARRVLKEGGQILILEPVADSLFERLFAVFDDESWKFKLAEKAIDRSGLKVFRSGSVRIWWVFEDFTEMAFYMFDYFGLELNREKENSMAQILGDRRGLAPLPIEAITRFWVLCER